ncbi:MAG: class I SAM-dependent methyltransferase [Acidobacteria bacterium]|nr:class I SAM-dependent methyltransferase [Acidobacteriota bacterium]
MNRLHAWYCNSEHWARTVEHDLLEWTLAHVSLGESLLELGAGAGTVTTHLRQRVARVTAVDVDTHALRRLRARTSVPLVSGGRIPTRVPAATADAAALPFVNGAFTSVAAFTMVHHLPGLTRQRALLSEVWRVLLPGGSFAGCDALWTIGLRLFHLGDTFAPVEPRQWKDELEAVGFDVLDVSTMGRYLRWHARARG